jgi:hypothetical protein
MKKQEKIETAIKANKELYSLIIKQYSIETFINDAKRYIKAIKQGRIICNIDSVSRSGMSRNIKFLECSNNSFGYRYYNFYSLFKALGFRDIPGHQGLFRIGGCGMDMIFYTNYTIIHKLHRLGFMSQKECDILAQKTPQVI